MIKKFLSGERRCVCVPLPSASLTPANRQRHSRHVHHPEPLRAQRPHVVALKSARQRADQRKPRTRPEGRRRRVDLRLHVDRARIHTHALGVRREVA